MLDISLSQAISDYIHIVQLSRSQNTARTYKNALSVFYEMLLSDNHSELLEHVKYIDEKMFALFLNYLKPYSPATERLYITAIVGFYEYLSAESMSNINLSNLRLLIKKRARKPYQRLPQFPRENIDTIIDYAINLVLPSSDLNTQLRLLRDKAFLVTLADTGLRVHEACKLRRGEIDWNEGKAIVIGKGNRQAVVRLSSRAENFVRDYISRRATIDGQTGRPIGSLAVFARHDRGAGKKIKPISTTTGRAIINHYVASSLGQDAIGTITPHSFRHYFVTTVLRGSGGNLKLAQELARHQNIAVTQRYAHLSDNDLDEGYHNIFDQFNKSLQ